MVQAKARYSSVDRGIGRARSDSGQAGNPHDDSFHASTEVVGRTYLWRRLLRDAEKVDGMSDEVVRTLSDMTARCGGIVGVGNEGPDNGDRDAW